MIIYRHALLKSKAVSGHMFLGASMQRCIAELALGSNHSFQFIHEKCATSKQRQYEIDKMASEALSVANRLLLRTFRSERASPTVAVDDARNELRYSNACGVIQCRMRGHSMQWMPRCSDPSLDANA